MNVDHWESYYRSGALVSCPTNPEPYYTLEVHAAWARFFSSLDNGSRLLDLGTGNGPVALIARETAIESQRDIRIDAVDLANIDPHRDVPDGARLLSGIEFHGGVRAENLPFDDATFDAISGQYIIEYTDIERAIAECRRVLKPRGRIQFVLHHSDSVIVRNGVESLRQAKLVQEETKTLQYLRQYCALDVASDNESARLALMQAGKNLQDAANASHNPLLLNFVIDSVSAILSRRRRMTQDELLQRTDRLESDLNEWVRRLTDLVRVARSAADLECIADTARARGFADVAVTTQRQAHEYLVGWRLNLD